MLYNGTGAPKRRVRATEDTREQEKAGRRGSAAIRHHDPENGQKVCPLNSSCISQVTTCNAVWICASPKLRHGFGGTFRCSTKSRRNTVASKTKVYREPTILSTTSAKTTKTTPHAPVGVAALSVYSKSWKDSCTWSRRCELYSGPDEVPASSRAIRERGERNMWIQTRLAERFSRERSKRAKQATSIDASRATT